MRGNDRKRRRADKGLCLVFFAALLASCSGGWSEAQSAKVDGYDVLFRTQPSPAKVGQAADLAVRINDEQGHSVRTCRVVARQYMPGMEMSTDEQLIALDRQGNGVYAGRGHEFGMGGDWQVTVNFDCSGKPHEASFTFHLDWPQ